MHNIDQYLRSRRFNVLWITASLTIFIISLMVLLSPQRDYLWMNSSILWFSLSGFGPAFIALMLNSISKLQQLGAEISDGSPRITVEPVGIAISSVVFLVFALATRLSVDVFPFIELWWAKMLAFFIACTFFLIYGAIAYMYILTFFFAIRLRKVQVSGDTFCWPRESIRAIHDVYIRLLLVGGTTYILGICIVRLTPWATSWQSLDQPWIHIWVLPPALALIVYFGIFSFALHRLLFQCRSRAEREISEKLQMKYDLWKNDVQSGFENSISALVTWRDNIRQERVWPMDFKTTIATIVTLLIPTIEAIVTVLPS